MRKPDGIGWTVLLYSFSITCRMQSGVFLINWIFILHNGSGGVSNIQWCCLFCLLHLKWIILLQNWQCDCSLDCLIGILGARNGSDWMVDRSVDWLIDWLLDWLLDWWICWFFSDNLLILICTRLFFPFVFFSHWFMTFFICLIDWRLLKELNQRCVVSCIVARLEPRSFISAVRPQGDLSPSRFSAVAGCFGQPLFCWSFLRRTIVTSRVKPAEE